MDFKHWYSYIFADFNAPYLSIYEMLNVNRDCFSYSFKIAHLYFAFDVAVPMILDGVLRSVGNFKYK